MNNLNKKSLSEVLVGLKAKEFSCAELVTDCLTRIEKTDSQVKSFLKVYPEFALEKAKKLDREFSKDSQIFDKKPLFGIPISVKDLYCTEGFTTTAGSKILEKFIPTYESTVTQKLWDSGAIFLGKTNLDAWAHGSSTERSDFFTTRNPWDLTRIPGGSSGGSAASIVSDQTIASIGTETGGSIRQPASLCGCVGLKPTYGRVSRWGVISMASSTDCPGPLTKTVEDSARILKVIAGKDRFDATSSFEKVENYFTAFKNLSIKNLRIGVPKEYFVAGTEKSVIKTVRTAIDFFQKLGAKISEVSLMDPKYSVAVYTIIQRAEVSSNLARYDGIRYGNKRSFFGREAKRRIMLGTFALSNLLKEIIKGDEPAYIKAQRARTLIIRDFENVFKKIDVIVAPTSPNTAIKIGESEENPMFGELSDQLVLGSTMAGLPGININCGFSNNLPIGMQIIGPQFSETRILGLAHLYETNTKWGKMRPNLEDLK